MITRDIKLTKDGGGDMAPDCRKEADGGHSIDGEFFWLFKMS